MLYSKNECIDDFPLYVIYFNEVSVCHRLGSNSSHSSSTLTIAALEQVFNKSSDRRIKCSFPSYYDRPTDLPTNRRGRSEFTLPITCYRCNNELWTACISLLYMHYLKIKIHQTNKFYQFRKKYAYEYFRGKETEIVLY